MDVHPHPSHERAGAFQCSHAKSAENRARVLALQAEVIEGLRQEFASAQDGLARAHRITSEAAGRLVQAFAQMSSAVHTLDELLETHESTMPAELHGELRALTIMMSTTSVLATESLQFEDLNAQLLDEVDARLKGLSHLSANLAAPSIDHQGHAACPAGAALDALATTLRTGLDELHTVKRTVLQRSLDPGEVDLF